MNHGEQRDTEKGMEIRQRYRGCLMGLAAGDALGATLEFEAPGSFRPITDMVGGGAFRLSPGQWTDDTSMALCLAQSLVEKQGFDPIDQLERYVRWMREGYLSSTGECFDLGNTTHEALTRFIKTRQPYCGPTDAAKAGNGSIMRLAPVPMFFAHDPALAIQMAADSSRTTHGAPTAVDACRYFAALIAGALRGAAKEELLSEYYGPVEGYWKSHPLVPEIAEIASGSFRRKEPPQIRGTGFVVRSLEAALWAFHKSDNFRDGCLLAVNLGDDADTTAAVYGQLAGAYYGEEGIPESWQNKLAMRDLIASLADRLCSGSQRAAAPPSPLESEVRRAMTEDLPVPFERSYWIVPGKFLAGAYPGDLIPEKEEEKLRALGIADIHCIVDLTCEDDRNLKGQILAPYLDLAQEMASTEGFKFSYHRKSIQDLGVPSHEEMKEILDIIDAAVGSNLPVYVHCLGGIGRTGTVVGCWLVRHGIARGQAAIECIRVLRRNKAHARIESPETAHQRRYVCEWREEESTQ